MENKSLKYKMGLLIAVMILVGSALFTVSYLADNETHSNALNIGINDIEITENFTPPTSAPTEDFLKKIAVTNPANTSTKKRVPCYVRVYIGFSDSRIAEKASVKKEGSATYYTFLNNFRSNLPANWVYIPEAASGDGALLGGYFYYTKILKPGETTNSLTERFKVQFASAEELEELAPNGYDINVYAESVSTLDKNGAEFTGTDPYKQAWREFLNGR